MDAMEDGQDLPQVPDPWHSNDGNHPLLDDGTEWRKGNGLKDIATRFASYGNFAGKDNRMEIEHKDEIDQKLKDDPSYDPYNDPKYNNDKYNPIDPIDAAARDHDHGYFKQLGVDNDKAGTKEESMFSWDGVQKVRDADRNIADDTKKELDTDPDHKTYTDLTHMKGEGLEGFFGSRANAVDAVHWGDDKAAQVENGVSDFADKVSHAGSVDEVGKDLSQGASDAENWLAKTGGEAKDGLSKAYDDFTNVGTFGKVSSIAGYASTFGAAAWDGVKNMANVPGNLWDHYAN